MKIGDKVIIIDNVSSHGYPKGAIGTIIKITYIDTYINTGDIVKCRYYLNVLNSIKFYVVDADIRPFRGFDITADKRTKVNLP